MLYNVLFDADGHDKERKKTVCIVYFFGLSRSTNKEND